MVALCHFDEPNFEAKLILWIIISLPSSNTSQHWNGSNPIHIKQEIQIPQVSTVPQGENKIIGEKNLTIHRHQVSSLTSSPDSSPSPGMMGVSQVSALLAQMLMHSNSLSFQSMMSNQQLIPGMSSQQMQGGQVGKIIPQKRFLTHCPLAGRRRGRSTAAAAAAASDGPNEKRAMANHNQPCPGHC